MRRALDRLRELLERADQDYEERYTKKGERLVPGMTIEMKDRVYVQGRRRVVTYRGEVVVSKRGMVVQDDGSMVPELVLRNEDGTRNIVTKYGIKIIRRP